MYLLKVTDSTLYKLPSFFKLTSHKYKLTVVDIKPNESDTFVGHEGVVV